MNNAVICDPSPNYGPFCTAGENRRGRGVAKIKRSLESRRNANDFGARSARRREL